MLRALLVLVLVASAAADGLGDRLDRMYLTYATQPLTATEATAAGWKEASGPCIPGLGKMYVNASEGDITVGYPTQLYYAANGQISGMGTDIFDHHAPNLVEKGYYIDVSSANTQQYRVTVGFREGDVCTDSTTMYEEAVGTVAIINPGKLAKALPLTAMDAAAQMYHAGSFIDGMGIHYMYDVERQDGTLSWNATNLQPIVPMFSTPTGGLNAIFFTAFTDQAKLGSKQWDPLALNNALFCANTCDHDCTFAGTDAWVTMHWFFHNPESINHPADWPCLPVPPAPFPGVGCCPNTTKHY